MNNPINIGLWGIGRAGWGMHCPELDKFPSMFQIKGACDLIPERMTRMTQRYPACRAYPDIAEMLATSDIDLISVAIRSPEHVSAAIRALNSGKYVFVEKPIGLNYEEVLRLKQASDAHPGKLFCRHNRRFEAAFQHVREIIASGVLGEIFTVKLRRHSYYRRADWQTLNECGGGQLNNWGPHLIDHALRLIDSPVVSVWGDMRKVVASGDAEDHFKAIIEGGNGRVADIEVSGGVAISSPVYAVYGKLGTLVANDEKNIRLKYLDVENCSQPPVASGDTPPLEAAFGSTDGLMWIEKNILVAPTSGTNESDIYAYLYRAIRGEIVFPIANEEAFEVARVSEMIRKAAR